MARRLSWSDVRGGLIATIVIVLLAFLTLRYTGLGALNGDTFKLFALVGEARGVLTSSEVWLSGQKVGKVTGIRFLSPAEAGRDSRLELSLDVLEKYRGMIRKDAVAQIRNGGRLIGAPVVYLGPGTIAAGVIEAGDTIKTKPQNDTEGAASQFGSASKDFPVIINNVRALAAQLQSPEGTAGAILNAPAGNPLAELPRAKRQASRLLASVSKGNLSPAKRENLIARARTAMARADSVRSLVASKESSLGRLRSDSTLSREVSALRDELSILRAALNSGAGTAGRIMSDSALVAAVHGAEGQMTALFADMKKHPLRYIRF